MIHLIPRCVGFSDHFVNLLEPRPKFNLKRERAPSTSIIVLFQVNRLVWHLLQFKCPKHLRYGEPDLTLCNVHPGADAPASAKGPVVAQTRIVPSCRLGRGKVVVKITVRLT